MRLGRLSRVPAAADLQRTHRVQTLSGTGANHMGVLFLSKFYQFKGKRAVYISDPTWGASELKDNRDLALRIRTAANHNAIISNVGLEPVSYPYYNAKTIDLDFDGYVKALEEATAGSVILVHGCAHNPTVGGDAPRQRDCV